MVEPPLPTWTKKVPVSLLPSASFTVYWMASLPCQPAFGLNRMVPSPENETVPPAALSEATEVTLSGPSPPLSFQVRYRAFCHIVSSKPVFHMSSSTAVPRLPPPAPHPTPA